GPGGAEHLAIGQPAQRQDPRAEDRYGERAPRHDVPLPRRRRTASNVSRSAVVSTTIDTLAGNAALPRCASRMGTMMSAASSIDRFPAPVPSGGTVTLEKDRKSTRLN